MEVTAEGDSPHLEMEFLDIKFTKDFSLWLLKSLQKKSGKLENLSLFMNSIL